MSKRYKENIMKKIGKVIQYDGHFGSIVNEKDIIEFADKDISPGNENVDIGDLVEFREEKRDPNLTLARNVKILKKSKN